MSQIMSHGWRSGNYLAGKSDCSAEFVNALALLLAGPIHAAQVQDSLDAIPPHVISAAGNFPISNPAGAGSSLDSI